MSEYIEITGGPRLTGEIKVSGAKNAVLPMLIASLLTGERVEYLNVPNIHDVNLTVHLLRHFGGEVEFDRGRISVQVPRLVATEASYSLVKAMRASFWVLGPLLARGRAARVALPGGDIIGARPVDMHLAGLAKMGADIKIKHGVVYASAPDGLKPASIELRFPSVGATHQILLAASLTPGTTVIEGAAREPEVEALANLLNAMGGDVEGAGTEKVVIRGKEQLGGATTELIGDRIEAATYIFAVAASGGRVRVKGFEPRFFGDFLPVLSELGLEVTEFPDGLEVNRSGPIRPISIATGPFPRFATDMQAPLMALLCLADGESVIEEHVFEGRFGHVSELCRMGAKIQIDERMARIQGVPRLTGAPVESFDIRGAVSLVVGAVAAEGVTKILEPQHLRRGYENLEAKLRSVGAQVGTRFQDAEDFMFTGC